MIQSLHLGRSASLWPQRTSRRFKIDIVFLTRAPGHCASGGRDAPWRQGQGLGLMYIRIGILYGCCIANIYMYVVCIYVIYVNTDILYCIYIHICVDRYLWEDYIILWYAILIFTLVREPKSRDWQKKCAIDGYTHIYIHGKIIELYG